MASWGLLFDRRGHILDEFDGVFQRSWGLNTIGECTFPLSVRDAKNTETNFQFGNHLVVLNDEGLPPWGGRLETPRSWGNKTNKHKAVGHESFFRDRIGTYTIPYAFVATAGYAFVKLIAIANDAEDTLIRQGDIYRGGQITCTVISPAVNLSDNLADVLLQSGFEYDITPVVNNNKLVLYANMYQEQGADTGGALNDSNCRIDENSLTENGPIYNVILGVGKEQQIQNHHLAVDQLSIIRYGLRAQPYEVNAVEAPAVAYFTETQLRTLSRPRRAFRATASNSGGLYELLRKGNRLQFESTEAGYGNRGVIGTQNEVRIIGMAAKDGVDGVALTIISI